MGQENSVSWMDSVCERLPEGALLGREAFRDQETVIISADALLEVMEILRDAFSFRYLIDLTALDFYPDTSPRFQVVYHLWSHRDGRLLRVKVPVESDPPVVPSVTGIWSSANWHERECYDLFGIVFSDHPELQRILLPDDWEGYPLRKDYPVEGY